MDEHFTIYQPLLRHDGITAWGQVAQDPMFVALLSLTDSESRGVSSCRIGFYGDSHQLGGLR
jgi:hypothetical protein